MAAWRSPPHKKSGFAWFTRVAFSCWKSRFLEKSRKITCLILVASCMPLDIHKWKSRSGYRSVSLTATWHFFLTAFHAPMFLQIHISSLKYHLSLPSTLCNLKRLLCTLLKLHFSVPEEQNVSPHIIISSAAIVLLMHSSWSETFRTQFTVCLIWEWITPFCLIPSVFEHQSNMALEQCMLEAVLIDWS